MVGRSGLAGSAAMMFSGTLVSRALGLARNALMVAAIGVTGSGAADAFSVANKLPNIIYMLLAGGILNAVLVPQIVRAMRRPDGGTDYVNRLLTIAGAIMLAITVALTAASGLLVSLYAAEFRNGPWASLAVTFAIWCIPQLFFYGMYTLLGQVLNARSNFGPYMWAPALNNIVSIAGLVAYLIVYGSYQLGDVPADAWDGGRIMLLAGPYTLGVAAQALILIVPLYRSGFRYRPRWGLRGSGLGSAGRVAVWAFAALAAGQVGYLGVSNLAAAAGTAAVSGGTADPNIAGNAAYDNAFFIFMLPQSLITVSLVTALFTRLSEHAVGQQSFRVRDDLSRGLRTLAVFTIFAAGAFMVLAIPLTQVVQFDQATFASYRAIGHVLVAMLIGLPAIAVWTMAQRVYFAFEDTRFLFFVQVPMALVQIGGSLLAFLLLDVRWWVVGAGVATTVSNTLGGLIAFLALRRKLPSLDGGRVLRTHLRVVLAVLPSVAAGWGLLHLWGVQTSFVGALTRVLVLGALMALIYYVLLRRLRVTELDQLTERVAVMASPLTRRLSPLTRRIVIPARLRTIWTTIVAADTGNGGPRVDRVADPALERGDTVADRYVLDAPAETGLAHAAAWAGQDEILQRRVQITVLGGAHREEALDAARRASLVRDDRLQRILRVGNYEDTAYLVTEPVAGVTLATLVASGPLPHTQARALVGNAAAALETARKRGVHHLQLSPQSVQLTSDGTVLVTGLAVAAAQAGTELPDARHAARTDAVHLVQLLYTALTGMWPGDRELAGGLPLAPRSGRAPEPPADVVDGVPHDLDTLCAVTFGPHQDGPYTPGELVRELQPWDQLDPPALPGRAAQDDDGGAHPGTANAAGITGTMAGTAILPTPGRGIPARAVAPDPGEPSLPGPEGAPSTAAQTHQFDPAADQAGHSDQAAETTISSGLARRLSGTSIAQRLGGGTAATSAAPPAAAPPAPGPVPPAQSGAPADAPIGQQPSPPPANQAPERPIPPTQGWDLPASTTASTPADSDEPGRTVGGDLSAAAGKVAAGAGRVAAGARGLLERARPEETEEEAPLLGSDSGSHDDDDRPRFNPTPWVIFAMVAILVLALILALGSLRDAGQSFVPAEESSAPTDTPSPEPTPEQTTEEPTEEPTESPEPVDISFTEASSLDPSTGSGDNPDLADQAIDGDADTIWRSLRYDNPTYGMKPGLGFAVELEEPTTVTTVTLDVQGEGGTVQIRNTSPDDPSGGEVLAEGAMGPDTTYTLSTPTELEAIVLWFPELPEAASDGRNRIELAEITAN
ncbi:MAG TPA: murein biosynthesis integral membrane protein MurJ [Candidatus Ruania gallistercoris]|uniref:Murein biosynthesis integral membrane protein MurJ n=1 Tax=Candidatus Ruania gallistercoris TaxID=2838746 RepID=A0A9D2J400_9MICO|nr:murein biosynthesis integral membrane protein MurJ [Candidatus Ruania gallistercoris]